MCAVTGVRSTEINAAEYAFMSLDWQQGRGDASTGIAGFTFDGNLALHRGTGEVKDVYRRDEVQDDILKLAGSAAIGQNRYPTSGGVENHDQPVVDEETGIALGHNGQLSVTDELEEFLEKNDVDTVGLNDTELMLKGISTLVRQKRELPDAIAELYPMLHGAFSCTALQGDMVVAFRDEHGIRPFSRAEIDGGHMVASETRGLYPVRARQKGDIQPGQMLVMTEGKLESFQITVPDLKLDIFEIVYFANADSEFFGESVGRMRYRFGEELAEQYPQFKGGNHLVTYVPDSAKHIAAGFARRSDLEYLEVFEKHRFRGGRSYQQPTQEQRKAYLDNKFSYISSFAAGRDLIVIDDSIVRLNTAKKINELARRAGARSVTFLVGSPPIGFPDFSGIDNPDQSRLIAAGRTPEQIRAAAGFDALGYLAIDRMVRATGQYEDKFNLASFDGNYPYEIGTHRSDIKWPTSISYLEDASAGMN